MSAIVDPNVPTRPEPPGQARDRRSNVWVIVLIVAAVVGVTGVGLVVGGAVLLFGFGLDIVEDQVRRDIENNPVIVEHIGVIEQIEIDMAASANESAVDVFVFRLSGTKGRGLLTANTVTIDAGTEQVTWGRLRAESGRSYDLFEDQGPKPQ